MWEWHRPERDGVVEVGVALRHVEVCREFLCWMLVRESLGVSPILGLLPSVAWDDDDDDECVDDSLESMKLLISFACVRPRFRCP
jgi:hypothetical protein